MKKKVVLVDPDYDKTRIGPIGSHSIFITLDCDDNGNVIDNVENAKIIKEAFFPSIFAKTFGIKED
jgi:hypothetical protein